MSRRSEMSFRQLTGWGGVPILDHYPRAYRPWAGGASDMEDVVIVSGVRTPIGKFQGAYSNLSASDLGAIAIKAAVERAGLSPQQVDHVIFGCVGQSAEDGYISRHAAVKAGMPIETPA